VGGRAIYVFPDSVAPANFSAAAITASWSRNLVQDLRGRISCDVGYAQGDEDHGSLAQIGALLDIPLAPWLVISGGLTFGRLAMSRETTLLSTRTLELGVRF
jgi:hypothetical protein